MPGLSLFRVRFWAISVTRPGRGRRLRPVPLSQSFVLAAADSAEVRRLIEPLGLAGVRISRARGPGLNSDRDDQEHQLLRERVWALIHGGLPLAEGLRAFASGAKGPASAQMAATIMAEGLTAGTPLVKVFATFPTIFPPDLAYAMLNPQAPVSAGVAVRKSLHFLNERRAFTAIVRNHSLYLWLQLAFLVTMVLTFATVLIPALRQNAVTLEEAGWAARVTLTTADWIHRFFGPETGSSFHRYNSSPVILIAAMVLVILAVRRARPWSALRYDQFMLAFHLANLECLGALDADRLAGLATLCRTRVMREAVLASVARMHQGVTLPAAMLEADPFEGELHLAAKSALAGGTFALALESLLPGIEAEFHGAVFQSRSIANWATAGVGIGIGVFIVGAYEIVYSIMTTGLRVLP